MARSWMMALVFAALFAAWPGGQVTAVKAYDKEVTARYMREGRVKTLPVRISDGEVVAVFLDKEDLPRGSSRDEEGRGWRYVAPRATIERSDPLKDGELAEKYRQRNRFGETGQIFRLE